MPKKINIKQFWKNAGLPEKSSKVCFHNKNSWITGKIPETQKMMEKMQAAEIKIWTGKKSWKFQKYPKKYVRFVWKYAQKKTRKKFDNFWISMGEQVEIIFSHLLHA